MQRFMQLVSQFQRRLGSIFKQRVSIGCSTEIFAKQAARGILHFAIATLQQSLRKVDFTTCFYFVQSFLQQKCCLTLRLRGMVRNFACSLCRNKIARQIAQYNSAFNPCYFSFIKR